MANNYTTVSKKGIEYLCSLINQLANVSEGIDDLNLRTDGTFSSVKIDTLLNTLKTDCNDYTDRLVANLSRLELKIATSESEITQPNTMYLYKPSGSTSYEQYVVIEGTKILLGTTDINMGDYYTITQADAKFVLKTDFDSLKTEVDKKVNKTDIVDNLTSTDTDKPLSANQGKVLKDEVDLKANDSDVVKRTDMVTTINLTSTNEKVPTAKVIYDECKQGRLINQSVMDTYGTEMVKYPLGRWYIANNNIAIKFTDRPCNSSGILEIASISPNGDPWTSGYKYRMYKYTTTSGRGTYLRDISSGSSAGSIAIDTGWQKVCTTKATDVNTPIIKNPTFPSNIVLGDGGASIKYVVRNGWVSLYIGFNIKSCNPTFTWTNLLAGLPLPANSANITLTSEGGKAKESIAIRIISNGTLEYKIGTVITTEDWWTGNIIYPVAES